MACFRALQVVWMTEIAAVVPSAEEKEAMHRRSILAGVAGSMFIASIAAANFNAFTWTLTNSGLSGAPGTQFSAGQNLNVLAAATVGGTGTLTSSTMTLVGGNANVRGLTWYTATAASAGTISVNWAYTNAPGGDSLGWDGGGYVLNGVFTVLAINSQSPASGSISFSVAAGDTFGFGSATSDGLFGAGTATFTNFVPAPGALALLSIAGLARSRRRG